MEEIWRDCHDCFIFRGCLLPKAIIFLCFNNKLDDWNNIFAFGLLMICNWRPNWWTLKAKVKEFEPTYMLLWIRWLGECCLLPVIQHRCSTAPHPTKIARANSTVVPIGTWLSADIACAPTVARRKSEGEEQPTWATVRTTSDISHYDQSFAM